MRQVARFGGATTMPEYYRIRHAQSADELLIGLGKFVTYKKSGPVLTLLPSTLHEISSRDATDVRCLGRGIGASGHC
jgi:hypothetical protein